MNHYPFELQPLPYSYDALEPYIDRETMMLHHDRHLQTYVDKLNEALAPYPRYHSWSLPRLLTQLPLLPPSIRLPVKRNGGGVYNHNLYFRTMSPQKTAPSDALARTINASFGSMDGLYAAMKDAGTSLFGSGYAYLVRERRGGRDQLRILMLPNQDTPLPLGVCPLLPLDVWEHAYYLKHHNLRADYIDNWFHVINWEAVSDLYALC